ncbi:MAG: hypothetical protein HKN39_03545 [Flavobacteriales bacterium]|nr:hypothetical protein [Flavobacteriales bacterium]
MKKLIIILFVFAFFQGNSQRILSKTHKPYGEIGLNFGTSYYIGDLNPFQHFEHNNFMFGFSYKWNPTRRHALKLYGLRTSLEAYDSDNKNPDLVNRNLHFRTKILEIGAGLEINFYEYAIGKKQDNITPYLWSGLTYFSFNPEAEIEGAWFELNSLNTEGQGSVLMGEPYKLNQLAVPIGLGFKVNMGGRFAFNMEYGVRKLFTDYLDDVSTVYANEDLLREDNGLLAVLLADRSLIEVRPNGTNEGLERGDPNNKDWYFITQASIAIKLGPPDNGCWK